MPSIKARMRVLRAEREWSQATLAKKVGASRAFINAVEKGRYLWIDPANPIGDECH
jgi:putative transcriptional regulator